MKIQQIINSIFRQNFKNPLVLGRSLYGLSILVMGFEGVLNVNNYMSLVPSYIPFEEFSVILTGIILIIAGFFILANIYLQKATSILILFFSLFILTVHLPLGEIHPFVQDLGFIGAALLIRSLSNSDVKEVEESK